MATELTKKEKGFANDYIDTGNGTQSIKNHYDTKDDNVAGVMAYTKLRKDKIQEYIADKAEDAASMVYNLSQNGKAEAIRLNASKDILDRAGLNPIEKTINLNLNETTPELLEKAQIFNEWWKKQQTA